MKRSEFLKKLGIGIGVAAIAPSMVSLPKEEATPTGVLIKPPEQTFSPKEFMDNWLQTGTIQFCSPDYFLPNDVVCVKDELYLVVSKYKFESNTYFFRLRPFASKEDIVVTDKWLTENKAVMESHFYRHMQLNDD